MGFWLKVDFSDFLYCFRATDTDENVYIYYFKSFREIRFTKIMAG